VAGRSVVRGAAVNANCTKGWGRKKRGH
jgi:hypothetical protein